MSNTEMGLGLESGRIVKRALTILEQRDTYFMDLIKALKAKYPSLSVMYANTRPGAKIDVDKPNPDFLIILKGIMKSPDPKKPDQPVVLIDAPMLFTERTIAGWTLAVEAGKKDAYLQYMLDKCIRISYRKFEEYIEHMCLLSLDKEDKLYWRSPDNTTALVEKLSELCARYTPRKPTRLADKRGYTAPTDKG